MEYVEAEGKSIDDAIEQALQRLGVGRDKVEIEIVSNATSGLFGLGGRKAKVRATLRTPLSLDLPDRQTSVSDPSPASPVAPRSAEPIMQSPAQAVPLAPQPSTPPGAELDRRTVEQAGAIIQETVRLMGTEATVRVAYESDHVRLIIEGETSGVLIGRRGQTLDALEYLINRIVAHEEEHAARLVVDSQDYRDRRRQALEALAQRLAERARRRGKTVTLNPMSPRDRRIIHLALQDDPSVLTRSSGKGYFRKLLIIPDPGRRGSRQRRGGEES